MPNRVQTFLISIAVIEGKHLAWPNMDSCVIVDVDKRIKTTGICYSTDNPYFNEYFVYEIHCTYEQVLDKIIKLTVIQNSSFLKKQKVLGYICLDVATVLNQKNHQFYHKWAILNAPPKEEIDTTRGYLKIDISIITKGEVPKIPKNVTNDDVEGNLLLPEGIYTERQRAKYIFNIYYGENLIKPNNTKPLSSGSYFVRIRFSGQKIKSSIQKDTISPIWNEKLIINELFPPLCQRIRIELLLVTNIKKVLVAHRVINLKDISNSHENGFLPTYGPNFLYFYSSNPLEGYVGKILIGISTELQSTDLNEITTDNRLTASKFDENRLLKSENLFLTAIIFEANCINKNYSQKPIFFKISCGDEYFVDNQISNCTPTLKPIQMNKQNYYYPIEDKKPIITLNLKFPDFRKRLYNSNNLEKIAVKIKYYLNVIENISRKEKNILFEKIHECLDFIITNCAKYIDYAADYEKSHKIILDKKRIKLCIKEMENIIEKTHNVYEKHETKLVLVEIKKVLTTIESLVEDPQDCWPLIYLIMYSGNKKCLWHTINPREIAYSLVEDERGLNCGIKQSADNSRTEDKSFVNMSCRVQVMLWIGLQRHKDKIFKFIPKSFSFDHFKIPKYLVTKDKTEFQLKAHIFQGRLNPGADKTSLADPLVNVIIERQLKSTVVIRQTLKPVWDQTLTFKNILCYGSRSFIDNHLPDVVIEVYDKDELGKTELIGRNVVKPELQSNTSKITLKWYEIYNKTSVCGQILAAFELTDILSNSKETNTEIPQTIPAHIKPKLIEYKVEILFWGVRHLKKINLVKINKPQIIIECGNLIITSEVLLNALKNPNFTNPVRHSIQEMPTNLEYFPPMQIEMFDSWNFGIRKRVGVHICSVEYFFYNPMTKNERKLKIQDDYDETESHDKCFSDSITISENYKTPDKATTINYFFKIKMLLKKINLFKRKHQEKIHNELDVMDWWTKFHDSLELNKNSENKFGKIKIYQTELEDQPEFENFTDLLIPFPIYRGKTNTDDTANTNISGVFKGNIKIYKWQEKKSNYVTPYGLPLKDGFFRSFPANLPLNYLLRVYCVRAIGLRPKDLNGRSDPYLYLKLNNMIINDKKNCLTQQIDPVFGKYFEFRATFPQDHTLKISIYDWDVHSKDDLIGETEIDLENRFYSNHRGHCGLAESYQESGYCKWKDQQKPVSILDGLTRKWNIDPPEYGATSVTVASKVFEAESFRPSGNQKFDKQVLALTALKHWHEIPVIGCHLVPEHVETRSLYNPELPGIEQGKLQMWIDIFPVGDLPFPKPVDISPRKKLKYELRVIIWNTARVTLEEDDFFTGEKKSDIYIKGWLADPNDPQYTDVHYRSLSGEGNFNWRFIFPFEYISTENKLVMYRKQTVFALDETEFKIPCQVTLQIWDNDTFSADDFLGILILELWKIPRGAPSSKKCTLRVLDGPTINLFQIRRTKGWWPFETVEKETGLNIFTGAVELEFELLTGEDAELNPAGKGRNEPQALPKPQRPDTSFSWFRSPFKAFKQILKMNKWKLCKCLFCLLIVFFIFMIIYSLPGYTVKKILGA